MTDSNPTQTYRVKPEPDSSKVEEVANQPDVATAEPATNDTDSTIIQPPAETGSLQDYSRSGADLQEEHRYKQVDESELNRLRALFIEPQDVSKFLSDAKISVEPELTRYQWPHPILLLNGKQSTGKMAAALFIAEKTRNTGNLQVLQYLDVRPPDLQTLTTTVNSINDAILIVNGISLKSLTEDARDADESLKHVARMLEHRNSRLILTCHELDPTMRTVMEQWSVVRTVNVHEATTDFVQSVIIRHSNYYHDRAQEESDSRDLFWTDIRDLLADNKLVQELAQRLRTPAQVNTFFEQLRRSGGVNEQSKSLPDNLLAIADGIGKTDRHTVRAWFRQLPPQTRLYAMLQHLFRGLATDDVYVIYRTCMDYLFSHSHERSEQSWKGLEELDEDSRILRRSGDDISFALPVYEQEVEQQIDSYRHQLWLAMKEKVIPLAEEYSAPWYWRLRMHLGHAIGRLGIYDWVQCHQLLDITLARHLKTPMRALCGHIISELLARIQHPKFNLDSRNRGESILAGLTDLMAKWITENASRQACRWTATLVLWRVFNLQSELKADNPASTQLLKLQSIAMGVLQEVSERPLLTVEASNVRPDSWQKAYVLQSGTDPNREADYYPDFGVVTETFMRLFLLQPETTIDLLVKWLQAGPSGSARIGRPLLSTDEATPSGIRKRGRAKTKESDPTELKNRGHYRTITVLKAICELLQLESSFGMQSISIRRQLLRLAEPCLSVVIPEDADNPKNIRELYLQPITVLANTLEGWLQELTDDSQVTVSDTSPDSILPAILEALLPAIDRSRDLQRSEFVTRIYQSWMNSSSSTVVNVGRTILARATFAEARCRDQPGQQQVLLVLDSSNDNRSMQLINDIAVSVAEQLRLESDVVWGRLGSSEIHRCDPQDLQAMRRPQTRNRPRLIMPLLEKIGRSNLHYALILTTEVPDDLNDAITQYEHQPLFRFCGRILCRQPVNPRKDLLGALLHDLQLSLFRDAINADNLRQVLENSREQMEESLLLRNELGWREVLSTFLPGDKKKISAAIVSSHIRTLLSMLGAQQGVTSMQQLHTCLQWLFLSSTQKAVSQAVSLLEQSEASAVGPCSRMLIRLLLGITRNWVDRRRRSHAQTTEVCRDKDGFIIDPSEKNTAHAEVDPPAADYFPALRLGLLIGRSDSPDGMRDYLECLNLLWTSAPWQTEILRCPEVLAAIDAVSDATGSELKNWLEKQLPRDNGLFGTALRQIKLGRRLRSHDLPSQTPCFAVLYDPTDDVCCRVAAFSCKLISSPEWSEHVHVQVFPVGSSLPLICPDGELPAIDKQEAARLPDLIGPAVEKLQRHRLSRLLLVTRKRRPVDLSDVADELAFRGYFCRWGDQVAWDPGWESIQLNPGTVFSDGEANELATVLQQCIESAVKNNGV